jgi:hypothetical protein
VEDNMRRFVALFVVLGACGGGNPIDKCESMQIDCCETDIDCVDFYGGDFPYCVNPGQSTGICSECVADADCSNGGTCVTDPQVGDKYCEAP